MKKLFVIGMLVFSLYAQAQVGIGTTSPNSTLDIRGSLSGNIQTFSSTYTATGTDYNLIFTGTSATTLTLPTAASITGRMYNIKNASSNTSTLTVGTTSSQTIDGAATQALSNSYQTLTVISDGSNWHIVGYGLPSGSGTNWSQGGNSVAGVTNLGTISNYSLPFITNNTEKMRISNTGNVAIGTSTFNSTYPEKLVVDAGTTTSVNAIVGKGTINNYLQLNIQNLSSGTNASSDVVATASNGTETTNYVDMGINGGGNISGVLGTADDAYLYNIGQNFLIGTGTAAKSLMFLTGGTDSATNERMRISGTGNVGIGTSTFNGTYPERLIVDADTTFNTNYQNVIVAKGNTNSYAQINIVNTNAGTNASADVIATADNGTESVNYVDLGINSSANTANYFGGLNDAYLYSIGNGVNTGGNLYIGTSTASRDVAFLTGGGTKSSGSTMNNERMRILGTGNVGIGTNTPTSTLDVEGSVSHSITNTTSNLTLDATNHTVIISSGSPTITLPTASSTTEGRIYIIVNNTGSARTISSYQAFGGAGSTTIAANSSITIQSYSNNWWRIQ